eukprot:TRINITY_DN3425_c0_g1_i1.p1 TRINITY_DN3425_c0_g1~~TRINITY_DN3425_c0_g1_i1.p1  ORF type:complete len:419 (+),score=65.28 TRINITY_DN3425_c0_g1_i1:60-1259(+)
MTHETAPAASAAQRAAAVSQDYPPVPKRCVVTGSSGFVGQRLVEMLVERGAERVVAFDIANPPKSRWENAKIVYTKGDLRCPADVEEAVKNAECVWHIAAAVGPFHPNHLYTDVNHEGTVNILEACKKFKVPKMVYSSSPSTRFTGEDVDGLTESELPKIPMEKYLQKYAETKALGELEVNKYVKNNEILGVSVAPHQVYGPRDTLFLTNILESAGTGQLRVFGKGDNRICFSHVDNYCHGLIISERSLYPGSKTLGKFYIVTDGDTHPYPEGYSLFWPTVNEAAVAMGMQPITEKFHLPVPFMSVLAYICAFITYLTGKQMKLTPFTLRMLTMHRWFRITAAETDLGYKPVIPFKVGWNDTLEWFKANWLEDHRRRTIAGSGYGKIADVSEEKIRKQM